MNILNLGAALPYLGARSIARLAQPAEQAGWNGVYVGDAIWWIEGLWECSEEQGPPRL